jgi:hypothetical protein
MSVPHTRNADSHPETKEETVCCKFHASGCAKRWTMSTEVAARESARRDKQTLRTLLLKRLRSHETKCRYSPPSCITSTRADVRSSANDGLCTRRDACSNSYGWLYFSDGRVKLCLCKHCCSPTDLRKSTYRNRLSRVLLGAAPIRTTLCDALLSVSITATFGTLAGGIGSRVGSGDRFLGKEDALSN